MGNKSRLLNGALHSKGFTLMELIVVIAILGALAALAIPKFTNVLENSQVKTDSANIRIVESAIEVYHAEKGDFDAGVDTFDEVVTVLNSSGYLKNAEITPVSEGKIFVYNASNQTVTLSKSSN